MAGMQWKQLMWIGIGLVGMFLISRIDYHTLMDQAPVLYLFGLARSAGGTGDRPFPLRREELGLAGRRVEFASVRADEVDYNHRAGAVTSAEVRTDRLTLRISGQGWRCHADSGSIDSDAARSWERLWCWSRSRSWGRFSPASSGSTSWSGLVLLALLIPVGWHMRHHLKPYQQQRIETFLHPEENPRGAGYQILQSEIAVGSGGFWGKGFGKGSQNQLGFVPVRYSDFILAALAEEQGFIGVCVVLLLYLGLILRLVDNAQKAKDRAGMYVVMGVTAILGFHVLVNASMVIGYMPVTGIPLPLMSYGGSATAFVFLALGMVMNVRMRRFVN